MVLRYARPNIPRPFRTPLVPLVPILGILICGYMMYESAERHVDPADRVDGDRPGHLLPLQPSRTRAIGERAVLAARRLIAGVVIFEAASESIGRRFTFLMHSISVTRDFLAIPAPRRAAIDAARARVRARAARRAVDAHERRRRRLRLRGGAGAACSRSAGSTSASSIRRRGPTLFEFLLGDDVRDMTAKGRAALEGIDLLVVLDISDVKRLGALAETRAAARGAASS